MKKLLILSFIFVQFYAIAQPVVHNSIGFEHTPYIYRICTELDINTDIYIIPTSKDLAGYTVKNGFGGYIIFANLQQTQEPLKLFLAHELQHISDDINGIWNLDNPTTKIKKYGNRFVSKEAAELEKRVISLSNILYKNHKTDKLTSKK